MMDPPRIRHRRRGRRWPWILLLLVALPAAGFVGYYLNRNPALVVLSVDLLDFGEIRQGVAADELTVEIRNQGEKALLIHQAVLGGEAAADFSLAADTCTGFEVVRGGACSLRLGFTPGALRSRRSRLELHSNAAGSPETLALLGFGVAPQLGFEPPELVFDEQKVGRASLPARLWLSNTGSVDLAVQRVGLRGLASADFVRHADGCAGRALAPGGRCSVEYRFVPTAAGERRAQVVIESDAPEGAAAPWLTGVGLPQEALLRMEPERLDFSTWPVGNDSPAQAVVLINDGDGPLEVGRISLGLSEHTPVGGAPTTAATEPGFELVTETCSERAIAPGDQCAVEIAFKPRAEGESRAFFEIHHSAPGELHALPVLGVGTAPHIFIDPLRLTFGEVPVASTSLPRVLRLVNSGTASLVIRDLGIDGADRGSFTPMGTACTRAALAPGAGCNLEMKFRPRRDGPHRAELVLRHNAERGGSRLSLNGIGVSARLAVDTARLDFGDVRVSEQRQLRLVLTNHGRAGLEVRRARLTGTYAGAFEIPDDRCSGTVLTPNASCGVTVRFAPGRTGTRNALLQIDHSAPGSPQEVTVTATGTVPPKPEIRLEPEALDFYERRVGERSPILTVTVTNPGSGRLELVPPRLSGIDAGDFRVVPGSCDGAAFVAPGASCTFGVRFTPVAEGPRQASFVLGHNADGGAARLELSGRGVVPVPVP